MDATLENFTENDVADAENDMPGADKDMYGAEDNISEVENDITGADDDITGADNDITGAENNIFNSEENIDETKENLDGTKENIDGIENIPDEGTTDVIAGATENAEENQQEHVENMGVNSDEKKWPGWPGETVFRVLVPYHRVGGLIGKKGDIIKKMCEETKTRIKVLDAPPGAPERAVIISAKEEPEAPIPPAIDGLLRVHKRIIDGLAGEALAPSKAGNPEVTRLLAGASQTGTLIGKHGANIKSIQEASNCVIRVIEDVPPFALQDDKVVEIQGEPTGMHKALELIASHLRKYLVDRSVVPIFEMQMSRPMSHMQHSMPPPQPWRPPQGPHAGGPGFNPNPHQMPPRSHDNYYPPLHDMPPYEKPPHHGISTFGRDVPPMGGHPSNNQVNQGTQYMQVPISFADAVIGAAGSNISYIRRTSGATITIQESRGVPGEMTVEINGSATQVQIAQQLIQNFMAEAGAPPAQSTAPPADHAYNSTSSYAPPSAYGSSTYASSTYAASAAPPAAAAPHAAGGGYGGAYASTYGASYGY